MLLLVIMAGLMLMVNVLMAEYYKFEVTVKNYINLILAIGMLLMAILVIISGGGV